VGVWVGCVLKGVGWGAFVWWGVLGVGRGVVFWGVGGGCGGGVRGGGVFVLGGGGFAAAVPSSHQKRRHRSPGKNFPPPPPETERAAHQMRRTHAHRETTRDGLRRRIQPTPEEGRTKWSGRLRAGGNVRPGVLVIPPKKKASPKLGRGDRRTEDAQESVGPSEGLNKTSTKPHGQEDEYF